MSLSQWQWETATAGAVAGFATVAAMYPLDIGLKGLYAGFLPAVLGSTVSWGLYFFFYGRAKQRYSKNREEKLSSGHHLASAAEAGALSGTRILTADASYVLVFSLLMLGFLVHKPYLAYKNEIAAPEPSSSKSTLFWHLCSALHLTMIVDALRTILREEGWTALYKGLGPGLLMVSHGAIQFTAYEELRRIMVDYKEKKQKSEGASNLLNSFDYALLGGSSKIAAILITYPFQVIRTRAQQRPSKEGIPRYMNSWHVVKETARFEGIRGFYKGITPNLLKNVPASSITFIVYENVLKLLRPKRRND
ncbi:hypothetical protein GOBAR_DD07246 [Gossypium barbadense]|nr:hypothetical protein GOBAR_DD07246 [Gossypium barbadense]